MSKELSVEEALEQAQQLIRDLRATAFVGSHKVRAADPLLRRCNEMDRQLTNLLAKQERDGKCSCPQVCDCQNPEPVSGAALISNECPIHNWNPAPAPGCRVHTGLTRD